MAAENTTQVELHQDGLVRSRTALYQYITQGPAFSSEDESERFQSDWHPYRDTENPILSFFGRVQAPAKD